MATRENQQRSVIVTAIVLAIILGGVLVWLLNRTPADQLTTQAPAEETPTPTEAMEIAQAPTPTAQTEPGTTSLSPTDETPGVQGVATTAPTGAGTLGLVSAMSGLGGLGVITLSLLRRRHR